MGPQLTKDKTLRVIHRPLHVDVKHENACEANDTSNYIGNEGATLDLFGEKRNTSRRFV